MTPQAPRKCPKCNSEMLSDRILASYTPVSLVKEGQFTGDDVKAHYCSNCGFIELYRGGDARK
jgi:predicted nucleic-acid-binding Zn-ribbon protein